MTSPASPPSGTTPTPDDFVALLVEGSALIRECAKGYGEPVPFFAAHDACKRLYRMGWRKVAPPELSTCARCGAENVVTSQSVCIKCVGKPARATPAGSQP